MPNNCTPDHGPSDNAHTVLNTSIGNSVSKHALRRGMRNVCVR